MKLSMITRCNNRHPGKADDGAQSPHTKEEEAFQRKVKEMSGHMFTVMWHVTELDIVSTITEVCFKVI